MITNDKSSGTYVIDEAYNIVSYNDVALELYPQLQIGKKCYSCLMHNDSPCHQCPVANNIKGAQVYLDPIRNIYETVDAVPMYSEEKHEKRIALIFGTTGQKENVARQLPQTEQELRALYENEYFDKITGGYTYRGFCREVEQILSSSDEEYVMLYLNVCNFKAINDIFGYEGGDALLAGIHDGITKLCQYIETFGRISADRFAILVSKNNLHMCDITNYMNPKWHYNGKSIVVRFQTGIYFIEDKSIPVEGMIDRARIAKMSIQDNNPRAYGIFDEKMRNEYIDRAQVISDFEIAIDNKDFKVFYQPVVSAKTGKIASAEALVRWIHPQKGLVPPDKFIPVLEKSGMISVLDRYVAENVYENMRIRLNEGKSIVPVAINLSWIDLGDEDMQESLKNMLMSNVIPKGYLRFEATERTLSSMETMCQEFLEFLRSTGSKILLDDFGSGYSSFDMIQKYDFDVIKLDRGFICGIADSLKTRNIIRAIITMCHVLGVEVIAEGVETAKEYEFLKDNQCDYIQGYYFAKPMPKEEFKKYLDNEE